MLEKKLSAIGFQRSADALHNETELKKSSLWV
jgi:hypothetical protein